MEINQKVTTATYVRLKVTLALYLSPCYRTRSLSTLIAVLVNKDMEDKIYLVMKRSLYAETSVPVLL